MNRRNLYYLASPYSHPDADVRQKRYEEAVDYMVKMKNEGINLISPIVLWHEATKRHNLDYNYENWKTYNDELIRICKGCYVLMIDGIYESKGVAHEIDEFNRFGKEIKYIGDVDKYKNYIMPEQNNELVREIWLIICDLVGRDLDFNSKYRKQPFNRCKHLAIYIYMQISGIKLFTAAKTFGYNHSTLIYHRDIIEYEISANYPLPEIRNLYYKVMERLNGNKAKI